jgi:hypothetical protein
MAQDKRREPRQNIKIRCWLMIEQGQAPIEAWIRDVSNSGARAAIASSDLKLPEQFTLAFTADLKVRRSCQLAWHTGNQFGVRFTTPGVKEQGRKLRST